MNDIIFHPVSTLFYCFGIIMPTILTLKTLGYLVFSVGELQEKQQTIPNIILLFAVKFTVIAIILYIMYIIIFDNTLKTWGLSSIIIFTWGLLISIDMYFIDKFLDAFNKYRDESKDFSKRIKKVTEKILKYNPIMLIGKIIAYFMLLICLIYNWLSNETMLTNFVGLEILLLFYGFLSFYIIKYIKSIWNERT